MTTRNRFSILKFVSPALFSALVAVALISGAGTGELAAAGEKPAPPRPTAELQPGEIVEIVIDALANNDRPYPDAGIETTFNFASPENRAYTGPLERFVKLVKGPVFGQMVDHRDSTLSEVIVDGNQAIRLVQIVSADNETFYYAFRLGLQQEGDFAGMWLTESVWPLENPEGDMLAL